MQPLYQICIPNSQRDFYEYKAENLQLSVGCRVLVPFRAKTVIGIVLGECPAYRADFEHKTIIACLDEEPLLDESLLQLYFWVAKYYQVPFSAVLPLTLPKKYRRQANNESKAPSNHLYRLALSKDKTKGLIPERAKKQRALLAYLENQDHSFFSCEALREQGFELALLRSFCEKGILVKEQALDVAPKLPCIEKPLQLNPEQQAAYDQISTQLDAYHCFLLQGITGSGKTEVYLQIIAKILDQDKQVLFLVPEIGLTPQLEDFFSKRFACSMALLHSHLSEQERQQTWDLAKKNKIKLIVGTRTAVFTPLPALGLIVIDEEHDASFKQKNGVWYSARDTALMRAHLKNIPVILGSATPSLETLYNAQQHKYQHLRLSLRAKNPRPLHYQLIDLRKRRLQAGLDQRSLDKIQQHLEQGNQVLVFINRRGYAPLLLCHDCGFMVDCLACDSHLILHHPSDQLVCHHCNLQQAPPSHCEHCLSRNFIPIGQGTQRLDQLLKSQFSKFSVARIDGDSMKKKHSFTEHLRKIQNQEIQLMIGTQMLAKGHHFPALSLVVVVDVDAGFYNQDFRATERLGQLLTQVAGRAGRADIPGEVLIQTHLPQQPLLNLLVQKGYDAFAQALLKLRQESGLPPYQHLAVIHAQHRSSQSAFAFLNQIKAHPAVKTLNCLGPAPAALARKAHYYRMQLLLQSPSRPILQKALTQIREWLTLNKKNAFMRWQIDVDPIDLL